MDGVCRNEEEKRSAEMKRKREDIEFNTYQTIYLYSQDSFKITGFKS